MCAVIVFCINGPSLKPVHVTQLKWCLGAKSLRIPALEGINLGNLASIFYNASKLLTALCIFRLYNIYISYIRNHASYLLCAWFSRSQTACSATDNNRIPFGKKFIWLSCSSASYPSRWSTPAADLSTH